MAAIWRYFVTKMRKVINTQQLKITNARHANPNEDKQYMKNEVIQQ